VNNNNTEQCDSGASKTGDGCTNCIYDCGNGKLQDGE
jgi:hypothetical protein